MSFERVPYNVARWLRSGDEIKRKPFIKDNPMNVCRDRDNRPDYLCRDDWDLRNVIDLNKEISFDATREIVGR